MDSVTVHHLARELETRWHGRRVKGCLFEHRPRAVLLGVDGSPAVRFELSGTQPAVRQAEAPPPSPVLAGWNVRTVSAPIDDRRLEVALERSGKFRGSAPQRATLEISLVPAAPAAQLRDAGGRRLAGVGGKLPPRRAPRPELTDAELEHAAQTASLEVLLRGRWVSPAAARWLLSAPGGIVARYRWLCTLPPAQPSRCGDEILAYPWCDTPEPVSSLIAPDGSTSDPPDRLAGQAEWVDRMLRRMHEELKRAEAAPRLRQLADALMALGTDVDVPPELELADGSREPVAARPGDTPVSVAERLYREVRSMERALQTLPHRIAARAAARPLEPRGTEPARRAPSRATERGSRVAKPYRSYRSSGGLDIWVGRGAKANDALTFREASAADVWLHARDAGGAHVVLRWQRDEPPPGRDLEEAALLAAWHSRARGSTVVPVDWTRRRYVRKPRGSAPGLVLLDRADTLFVRPSADVERRLRRDGGV